MAEATENRAQELSAPCRIRPLAATDAAAVKPLLDQLGYAMEVPEIERRIALIAGSQGHLLIVAEVAGGAPCALLHAFGRAALEKPPEAVVQALVVGQAARGRGIGKIMMAHAENWAAAEGYRYVALGSQIDRGDAHEFYRRLGYERYATSHHFRKTLQG